MSVTLPMGIGGEFRLFKGKAGPDGGPLDMQPMTDWFSNHVLDSGLDMIGTATSPSATDDPAFRYLMGAQLGSGNTPPDDGDTELENWLGSSVTRIDGSQNKNLSTLPYYFEVTRVFRFVAGVATGNITECSVVYGSNDSAAMNPAAPLFARSLVVDESGSPASVTKLADEVVDLHYRLRYYINTQDVIGSIEIGGNNYDYTLRPLRLDRNFGNTAQPGWGYRAPNLHISGHNGSIYASQGEVPNWIITGSNAALAPLTGADPAGTITTDNLSINYMPYVPGSHEVEHRISCALGRANVGPNHPDGIGVIVFSTGISSWQLGLEPNLVKTSNELFNISIFHTWERYSP